MTVAGRTLAAVTGCLKEIAAQVDGQAAGSLFKQSYSYDSLSNLVEKRDAFWDPVKKTNMEVTDSYTYDNLNRLSTYTTLGGGVTTPSTVQVVYDARGNIVYKSDVGRYWYDVNRPNRLVQVTLEGYGGAQALSGTRAMSYAFDDYMSGAKQGDAGVNLGNGNLMYTVSQDSVSKRHTLRWETYTSFNMPKEVKYASLGSTIMSTAADRTLSFTYGPEHQRVKQVVKLETNAPTSLMGGTTWYLHGSNNSLLYEKEVKANGVTEHRHYLQAAGMTVALAVVRSGTGVSATHANVRMRPTQLTYYQQDHLGSIALVTDANGAVLERMAYDPWGKRRFTTGLADKNDSIVGVNTDRGYTEHEHLDEMGVIHMNGRLYDPLVGRFMSADPYIQSPENLQSYNRFAYVMNNPLAYTDPSGYWSWKKFRQAVIMIGVAVTLGPAASGYLYTTWGVTAATASIGQVIVAGAISGAVAGYAGGYLSVIATGGNSAEARAAGKSGAISGMLFGAAGGVNSTMGAGYGYAAQATAGCLSAVAGGGKCGEGASAAVFGMWSSTYTSNQGWGGKGATGLVVRGVASIVAGGIGSVIAGGKFANGAESATYAYLFNIAKDGFGHLSGDGSSAGPINGKNKTIFLNSDDPNFLAAKYATAGPGEYLIIGHGNESAQTFEGMTASETATYLRENTGWVPGQKIRVDSCWLGKHDNGFAQQLANTLDVVVVASPVRTLSFGPISLGPFYSVAVSSNYAIPIAVSNWRYFVPR